MSIGRPIQPDEPAVLRAVMEATAQTTGEEFLRSLVEQLAAALQAEHVVATELMGSNPSMVRTLAFWSKGRLVDNVEWDPSGTPCERVVAGGRSHHAADVGRLFPRCGPLPGLRIESYSGLPLIDRTGSVVGHLAVFDERPALAQSHRLELFGSFAARAVGELERIRIERRLRDSEQQFRDLFEQAPIAYVYEETNTHFVSANRAFMDLLGLTPEEVPETYGLSLVAATPDVQDRLNDSLVAEQIGEERAAIEIELRRKDDGRPVYVQRWSRPEPDGKHTRTMIIDITARVLAEREQARLQQQNRYLQEEINTGYNFEEIVGRSSEIHETLKQVEQVAATDTTVLLLGETGTGKELIARALHGASRRKGRPLIKLNCAALPTGLVESELFGHEKGSFTGATEKRVGRFVLADGGTIFLDEIGEMPLEVQVKLLRVLQEREFEPVGSTKTQRADVRIIAATNRDLGRAVAEGSFRADLFYRLNVFPISIPPLCKRQADIPLLAHYFVNKYSAKIGRRITGVEPRTIERLVAYPWPGNIRELENVIERAIILSSGPELEISADMLHGPGGAASRSDQEADSSANLADHQRRHILDALRETDWVIEGESGAARRLSLNPNTLRSRMKKMGIRRDSEAS